MPPDFTPKSFDKSLAHLRRPAFSSVTAGSASPPPTDSPLKVWTGTEWAPAGVKVEE